MCIAGVDTTITARGQPTIDDIPTREHWLVRLRAALVETLAERVWTCEDAVMTSLELDVIRWHTLLMLLTGQHYLRTRTAIVELIKNFFVGGHYDDHVQ